MRARIDLTGRVFGRLTVVRLDRLVPGHAYWFCLCKCGAVKSIIGQCLKDGRAKSCGCLRKEITAIRHTTHGHTVNRGTTKTYRCWYAMKDRCYNPNNTHYARYGGRGIAICDRWRAAFQNFLDDMGESPNGLSIERINNDGNYEPCNCRWATMLEQSLNKKPHARERRIEFSGVSLSVRQWAKRIGTSHNTILRRLKKLSIAEALTRPIGKNGRRGQRLVVSAKCLQ